jgi:hypothetical protein
MAAPERFPKDGVYIWCDPDGLWTMFWKGREKFTVHASVTAAKPVIAKIAVKAQIKSLEVQSNSLEISSAPNSRVGITQFASVDDSVQFNILVNGKADPNRVYIGSRLNSPKQFPLELAVRRTLSRKRIPGTGLARRQESVGPTKETPTPVAPSHGSGGGGGSSGRKAKK